MCTIPTRGSPIASIQNASWIIDLTKPGSPARDRPNGLREETAAPSVRSVNPPV